MVGRIYFDVVTADSDVVNKDLDAPDSSEDIGNHTCLAAFAVRVVRTLRGHVDRGSEVRRLMLASSTVECDILGGKVAAYVRLPSNLAFLFTFVSHNPLITVANSSSFPILTRSPDEEYCPVAGVLYGLGCVP